MSSQFFLTVLTAVLSSSGGFTILQWWLNRRESRRQQHAEDKLAEHDAWLRAADKAYRRVTLECDQCNKKLDKIGTAFYGLLDDLEDQVVPMLTLQNIDLQQTRDAMRVLIRKAREGAR